MESTRPRPIDTTALAAVRRRLKIVAVIMAFSGALSLTSAATVLWVFVAGALAALATAGLLWAIATLAEPSRTLIRVTMGLAVLRVVCTLAATLTLWGLQATPLISGLVFPGLLAAYTIVQLRELERELPA